MISVRQLMNERGETSSVTISQDSSVYDALKLMAEMNVGAVTIVENNQIVGIFTERDYARKIILKGKTSLDTPIKDIMTREMVTISPDQTLEECMGLMTKWHIRHLPVMETGRLVGMISMRDVVEAIIQRKDDTIDRLEKYIMGEGYPR
jgi:CBS domain-containing protein